MTTARWIREFVTNHPEYKNDSVVSDRINYDLLKRCADISTGKLECNGLLPSFSSKTTDDVPKALSKTEVYLNKKNPHTYGQVNGVE